MKILFLQQSSLVQAYRRVQAKCKMSLALKIQAKKVGGESPLLKIKLNEYLFCNLYCLVLIRDENFEEKNKTYNILFCLVP